MDISKILEDARKDMVEHGKLGLPMLYLELSEPDELHLYAMDVVNDHQSIPEQATVLFSLGRDEGKKHPGRKIASVTWVSEAWASRGVKLGQAMMPRDDPGRREIIVVETWEPEKGAGQYTMEVKRNKRGKVIQVGEPEEKRRAQPSYQLGAFNEGWIGASLSDEELEQQIARRVQETLERIRRQP
jgi:hypothetical protein